MRVSQLGVKIFADGADKAGMLECAAEPLHQGLTTNPTLMRKAGIPTTRLRQGLLCGDHRPANFVRGFSDDFDKMERAGDGDRRLGRERLRQDPHHQHRAARSLRTHPRLARAAASSERHRPHDPRAGPQRRLALGGRPRRCISVFAGRIADTGRDPVR